MNAGIKKRHIGVITPREVKHQKYLDELARAIVPGWRVIPHTLFYDISHQRLLQVSRAGAVYDVVVAARLSDQDRPELHNIFSAALEVRHTQRRNTIFVITFNELQSRMRGHDVEAEKAYLQKFIGSAELSGPGPVPGVVFTSSTDPLFLVSILGDILAGPAKYLAQTKLHHIESQTHFLNHPPDHTLIGIRP